MTNTPTFAQKAKAYWAEAQCKKLMGDKKYLLTPSDAPDLLRVLGLLNSDASMSADAVRKFQQINHMVNLLLPQLVEISERHKNPLLLDACCGTSFIALVLAWLFHTKWNKSCRIIGIDRNPAVIAKSRERAELLGYGEFCKFSVGEVSEAGWLVAQQTLFPEAEASRPHLLAALHACDTATDYALALGVKAGADFMAIAPCCQAELAKQWSEVKAAEHPFAPIFQTPNLRRELAASFTDTLRLLLIRGHGYEVTATEFVPAAHTPKNRLLVCTRRGKFHKESKAQYQALKSALAGSTLTLENLLS
jgi:hypothetical protein